MDMYRIEAEWVSGQDTSYGQSVELVAGFTPKSYIASGNWFGCVRSLDTVFPFVLTDDGHCRYAGDRTQTRYFSIVTRPVKLGEIFELTWDDHADRHCYKVTKVVRLNINLDQPDEDAHDASALAHAAMADSTHAAKEPGIFFKTSLVRRAPRPHAFKATVVALIEAGNSVAIGQDKIDQVFDTVPAFTAWFDTLRRED